MPKVLSFNSMVSDYEIVNPEFARVKVYVCYAGKNRNMSSIDEQVLEKMSQSIYGVPMVAEYDKEHNCFTGHGGNIEITESDVAFLYWDGTAWVKHSLNLSSVIDGIKKAASDAGIEAKNALDAAAKAADKANQAKSAADTNKNSIQGLTRTVGEIETKVNGLNVPKIVCLTQAEYEALEVKDPDTFYYTNEE